VALTRRTQILLDEERHRALRRRSAASGRSVGELIREGIDRLLADEGERDRDAETERERAFESFLSAEPMPVDDWPVMEREIEEAYERGGPWR
jgi:plasmid stability protein